MPELESSTSEHKVGSIAHLLRRRALEQPNQLAYAYPESDGGPVMQLSYAALDRRAREIAYVLLQELIPGDRALVQCKQPLDFIASLFGCFYAGVVAVPINTARLGRQLDRCASIMKDAQASVSLTTSAYLNSLAQDFVNGTEKRAIRWIKVESLGTSALADDDLPAIDGDALAYLQYTSGSTDAPKGVAVSHSNLLSNARDLARILKYTQHSCVVSWLPLFHDMGLFHGGFLPTYAGCPGYLMEPGVFLWRPVTWLRAATRYRATHLAAPNFAIDLCSTSIGEQQNAVDIDLRNVVSFGCGSEPVREQTLNEFAAAFKPYGFDATSFCPGYGLAEASLMVTVQEPRVGLEVRRLGKRSLSRGVIREMSVVSPGSVSFVSNGSCQQGTEVVIVDPNSRTLCDENSIGEIWVAGPSVARGYWNLVELTRETFAAYIDGSQRGPYLRTGDLGFLREGKLYVTGRLKDVIIIRGRNHYPQDLESTVQHSHSAFQRAGACAFSIDENGEERLVIAQEVRRTHVKLEVSSMIHALRHAVAEEHQLQVHAVRLLKPGALPRTSSGKIERKACRHQFLEGSLQTVGEWTLDSHDQVLGPAPANSRALRAGVLERTARRLDVAKAEINTSEPLERYGLDSLAAIRLAAELSDWLGRELSPTLLYDYPSLDGLCDYLLDSPRPIATAESAPVDEPIAIVGMACRFPGAADLEGFRRLLFEGIDAVSTVSQGRHGFAGELGPSLETAVKRGGFLEQVDLFDPLFFGISPREAMLMDPHQRLLLEVTWEALEHAAISPDLLAGTDVGVFIGLSNTEYLRMMRGSERLDSYVGTGNASSIAANRLSYVLDLRGPSMVVDTACSSSLVAVHQACEALRRGQIEVALAGGAQLLLNLETSVVLAHANMLSPRGRCHTFDATADGYVRGEGCGIVVLKPLSKAIADGDRVHGLILNSGVNQDGRSNGLTAPSGPAQEALLRRTVSAAGVRPGDVGFIETHGTGTSLGDPIEIRSVRAVYGEAEGDPCYLGALKTNIGHLEAAAGIAGLIKTLLVLEAAEVPPNLNFQRLNPEIRLDGSRLRLPTTRVPWRGGQRARLAAVNSFGFGGTNCHVILQEAPPLSPNKQSPGHPPSLLTLSAGTEEALGDAVNAYLRHPNSRDESVWLGDVCYTSNIGRKHFEHRLAVVGRTAVELNAALTAHQERKPSAVWSGTVASQAGVRIAFLFTGQGAQYPGMGRDLFKSQPVFRKAILHCDEIARDIADLGLLDILYHEPCDDDRIHTTEYAQPTLFAIGYALARMWAAWGVMPQAVMGHGVGELIAACVAGVCGLEDAVRLVIERGRLMQALPHGGAMAAVSLSESAARAVISKSNGALAIAAVNGPDQVVLSGPSDVLAGVTADLARNGVTSVPLKVSHAFHSPLMAPAVKPFEDVAGTVSFGPPLVDFVSSITGKIVSDELSASYWSSQLLSPVRFLDGVRTLQASGCNIFLEIGPRPLLSPHVHGCLLREARAVLASMTDSGDSWNTLLECVARLYVLGMELDWAGVHGGHSYSKVGLPGCRFRRERYWPEGAAGGRQGALAAPVDLPTDAAGFRRVASASEREVLFESRIGVHKPTYLAEHQVQGAPLLPAAWVLTAMLKAGREVVGGNQLRLERFDLAAGILLPASGELSVQVVVETDAQPGLRCRFCSEDPTVGTIRWRTHATASFHSFPETNLPRVDTQDLRAACTNPVSIDEFYESFERHSIDYGPNFRKISELSRGARVAWSRINLSDGLTHYEDSLIHPILLDGCLRSIACLCPPEFSDTVYLPSGLESFELYRPCPATVYCHARLLAADETELRSDLLLIGEDDFVVAKLSGFICKRLAPVSDPDEVPPIGAWLHDVTWQPQPVETVTGNTLEPAVIAKHVRDRWARDPERAVLESHLQVVPTLNALAARYALDAVLEFLSLAPLKSFTLEALADGAGVLPRHHKLLGGVLRILKESGAVRESGARWSVAEHNEDPGDTEDLAEDLRKHIGAGAELDLLQRCGKQLASTMQGARDPLSLLFPDGDTSLLASIYGDSPVAKVLNAGLSAAFTSILERAAPGRPFRVLEIGGGTGGSTAYLVDVLEDGKVDYTFTDISPHFLAKAEQKFGSNGCLTYRLFDVEQPPEKQGFRHGSYDLVIASNVLHATADLTQSLKHAARLLRTNGSILIVEGTRPQPILDLTFGLTDGWWRFRDRELRGDYPLVGTETWTVLLKAAGFQGVEVVTPESKSSEVGFGHSLFLARLGDTNSGEAGSWLVLSDAGDVGAALADDMRGAGCTATVVRCGDDFQWEPDNICQLDPTKKEHFVRLLDETLRNSPGRLRGIVHTWSAGLLTATSGQDVCGLVDRRCAGLLFLVQAIKQARLDDAPRLWVVTRCSQPGSAHDPLVGLFDAPLWGMARGIALESPELRCTSIDLDSEPSRGEREQLLSELMADSDEDQVALRAEGRFVARLTRSPLPANGESARMKIPEGGAYKLVVGEGGGLDSLRLAAATRRPPEANEIELKVEFTGLNFKDLLAALGQEERKDDAPLGSECAGIVTRVGAQVSNLRVGDEVIALADGGFSRYVNVPCKLAAKAPQGMRLQDAVCIPSNFLTAKLALEQAGKLRAGDTILIHAAAGGTGSAAVQVARNLESVAIGSARPWKWPYLRSLGVRHVANSRDTNFADLVHKVTAGRGADALMNSLTGGFIEQGFSALRSGGRFLEIGRSGILSPKAAAAVRADVQYHVIDLAECARQRPELIQSMLIEVVGGFERGIFNLPSRQVFSLDKVTEAFRYVQQARHLGKVVIDHRHAGGVRLDPLGTYLVTGGLGGLGLRVGCWLAENGAGTIVLLSRSPAVPANDPALKQIERAGAKVKVAIADVGDERALANVVEDIESSPHRLRGVIHAAGVLDDGTLAQLNAEQLSRVLRPKVVGGWNLHQVTRQLPLDVFVVFSSAASVLGSPGQANHAAANAFLDGLACFRKARGLPALSIQWGIWSETGAAARKGADRSSRAYGLWNIVPHQGLRVLQNLWNEARPTVAVIPANWRIVKERLGGVRRPLLEALGRDGKRNGPPDVRILEKLAATPVHKRSEVLRAHLRNVIARVLGLDAASRVTDRLGFFELGMDSLTSMELRNLLYQQFGRQLPPTLTFDYPTVSDLARYLVREVISLEFSEAAPRGALREDELGHLSDTEVEAELDNELGGALLE